jgi:hypothetical protein
VYKEPYTLVCTGEGAYNGYMPQLYGTVTLLLASTLVAFWGGWLVST